jgi:iron complex transport system substrate-binding protein
MRARVASVIAVTLISLSACGSPARDAIAITPADVVVTKVDPSESPAAHRVVALANGSAEIIDAMGLTNILVGRDIASTEPALKSVPIVTSGHQVIAEKIIALHPDLVIIDASVGPQQALDALRAASIKVVTIKEAWSVGEISSKVSAVSAAIGAPRSGVALSEKLTAIPTIKSSKKSPRIAFLYLRGGNSIYLLGGKGSGADSVIDAIGGIDVGSQVSKVAFAPLTAESFAKANPQIILVMTKGLESVGGVSGLLALPGVAQTDAGKNARVIAVDDSLLLSFGPRTPSMLKKLAAAVSKVAP